MHSAAHSAQPCSMPTQSFSAQGMQTSGSLTMAGSSPMLRLMLG